MGISKITLPQTSALSQNKYDYADSFVGTFTDTTQKTDAATIAKVFFTSGPKWIEKLFALRNAMVRFIGLKTPGNITDRQAQLDRFQCEPGEQLGLFKVFSKTDDEVILGEDDKHLNFRVSLLIGQSHGNSGHKTLTISTTVQFNNRFGKLYFLPVRPFHSLIVPTMLRGIIRQIETKN